MWVSEQVLYLLAKLLYRTEAAHSQEMKQALSNREENNRYRCGQMARILSAAKEFGVEIADKVILDLGCNDGAITVGYPNQGARQVVGVDIDEAAIRRAQERQGAENASFCVGRTTSVAVPDNSFDVVICYDVFEHVSQPAAILAECHRLLKPGGKMLIGTWGWYHPYAPHLWSTMPVPWAHVLFSERTVLRTCRRVYQSPWYVPTMHDVDEHGNKKQDKYQEEEISREYLNKLLIRDFKRVFDDSPFDYTIFPHPFGSKFARWTKVLLTVPWIREFVTSYIWVVLEKRQPAMTEAPTRALLPSSVAAAQGVAE
jgi:2-polyprenyl-3-methyl-5-hydroxy-6-metoxy-1,4-benzoquinol methylase